MGSDVARSVAAGDAAAEDGGLVEARALAWRERASARTLRRDGRRWTAWTAGVVATFSLPSILLIALEPLMAPFALIWAAHGWAVCRMQASRGVKSIVPIGSERSASRRRSADDGAERIALGLLGDLVGHEQRELLAQTGLVLERGSLGSWLVGEQGALLVEPPGRRAHSFCVRVADATDLPGGDRVAHLLLALREDELGLLTVANINFSGATWRCRLRMKRSQRPALDAARDAARAMNGAPA
jgi:hypothetical protein